MFKLKKVLSTKPHMVTREITQFAGDEQITSLFVRGFVSKDGFLLQGRVVAGMADMSMYTGNHTFRL